MPIAIPIGLSAVEFGISEFDKHAAQEKLDAINREAQSHLQVSPELRDAYNSMKDASRYGYSPEQRANFTQGLARSENTAYQHSIDRAPNLAQQILSGQNFTNINAMNQFEAGGANLQLRKMQLTDTLGQAIQHQKNLIAQGLERIGAGYGGAVRQNKENEWQALNMAGSVGYQAALGNTGMGVGNKTTSNTGMGDYWNLGNTGKYNLPSLGQTYMTGATSNTTGSPYPDMATGFDEPNPYYK